MDITGTAPWDDLLLTFVLADGQDVLLPALATPRRTDGLWKSTCFELFVKPEGGETYVEFNASPSGEWAAYAFDAYREGRRDQPLAVAPHIEAVEGDGLAYDVDVDLSELQLANFRIALSAVIEETDGTKSYWALRHPPGKPDFHHPDCFALELAAPDAP